jgi:hypothetical protein
VAELAQELAELFGAGGHTLQVGERARRSLTGVEHAHDRANFVFFELIEASVQAGLVEAPIPIPRRRGEEQQKEVALGEVAADRTPPVPARRYVNARDEAFNLLPTRGKAFQRPLHLDRECVILVLVADEYHEDVVSFGQGFFPPFQDANQISAGILFSLFPSWKECCGAVLVMVPDTLKAVATIEKDRKRFPDTHGWA